MTLDPAARVGAFLFDQDGVLIDSAAIVRANWRRFTSAHGLTLRDEDLPRIYGRRTVDILVDVFAIAEGAATAMADAWIDARSAEVAAAAPITAVPGAVEFVRASRHAGIPLALVSSASSDNVAYVLDLLGLGDAFGAVITASDVDRGKPGPDGYLAAMDRLGVDPEGTVVFEDSPAGLEAGRAAGALVVGITTTLSADHLAAADLVLDDFRAISPADLIGRLPSPRPSSGLGP